MSHIVITKSATGFAVKLIDGKQVTDLDFGPNCISPMLEKEEGSSYSSAYCLVQWARFYDVVKDRMKVGDAVVVTTVINNPWTYAPQAHQVCVVARPASVSTEATAEEQYNLNFDRFLADPSLHSAKALAAAGRKLGRDVSPLQDYINTVRADAPDLDVEFAELGAPHSSKRFPLGKVQSTRCRTRRLLAVDRRAARHFAEANA